MVKKEEMDIRSQQNDDNNKIWIMTMVMINHNEDNPMKWMYKKAYIRQLYEQNI